MTLLKPGKILISDDEPGRHILNQMKENATMDYKYILVPDEKGSNVVYISQKGQIIHSKITIKMFSR